MPRLVNGMTLGTTTPVVVPQAEAKGSHPTFEAAAQAWEQQFRADLAQFSVDGELSAGEQSRLQSDLANSMAARAYALVQQGGGNLGYLDRVPVEFNVVLTQGSNGEWSYQYSGRTTDGLAQVEQAAWPNVGNPDAAALAMRIRDYKQVSYLGGAGASFPTDVPAAGASARTELSAMFPEARARIERLSDADALRTLALSFMGVTDPRVADRSNARSFQVSVVTQTKGPLLGGSHYIMQLGWNVTYMARELGAQYVASGLQRTSRGWTYATLPPSVKAQVDANPQLKTAMTADPSRTVEALLADPKFQVAWAPIVNVLTYNVQRQLLDDANPSNAVAQANVRRLVDELIIKNRALINPNFVKEGALVVLPKPSEVGPLLDRGTHAALFT